MAFDLDHPFPRDNDGLAVLHEAIASDLESGLLRLGEALALTFGETATQGALRALLSEAWKPAARKQELLALFDRLGWRGFLADQFGEAIDSIELTQPWRDGAEYAGQGLAAHEPRDRPPSLEDREARVKALAARGATALRCAPALFSDTHLFIWEGVAARAALDFGKPVSLEGLRLLSGVTPAAIRNATSTGELRPDEAGEITAEAARAWLARRREFCPSRWTNLADRQWPFDPAAAVEPDDEGMIRVPQDAEGTPFLPQHVVRSARGGTGLSVTIGAKGAEEQHQDFYEALRGLTKMEVARWRRRNSVGNWGIVRARGAWVAVSKAEIDRQLAEKRAETA
ncbi:hypothetical protein [Pseudoroseomonas ludipueritiae]|uniref:Uncharacterized protein n=1 Tax=Pseudoroseomonas ludipueritiae TaxID=198093 RepID=A0ABR7R329_9PROT|nr:hypothetical protein [Pseudoroseomonas ludipueritiae]MBC9176125.1 hypothetical protein [Pseudoroseomonas ludipueritiae]